MAEAIMNHKGREWFTAYSAGSDPADEIHPMALEVMTKAGFNMTGHRPKPMDMFKASHFDFVITLCDTMKETCPVFPGQPVYAHWGMPDPAAYQGTAEEQRRFFRQTMLELTKRITLFVSLPLEKLDRMALETAVQKIAEIKT
jgi:arsenate reductase